MVGECVLGWGVRIHWRLFHSALYFVEKETEKKRRNDRISSPLEDDEENISKPRAFWHRTPKVPRELYITEEFPLLI